MILLIMIHYGENGTDRNERPFTKTRYATLTLATTTLRVCTCCEYIICSAKQRDKTRTVKLPVYMYLTDELILNIVRNQLPAHQLITQSSVTLLCPTGAIFQISTEMKGPCGRCLSTIARRGRGKRGGDDEPCGVEEGRTK